MTPPPAAGGDDNVSPCCALAAAAMWPGWASFAARRGFELFVFTSKGFDGLPQLPFFPLVIGYLFIGQSGEFQSTEQRPLPALFFA